MERFLKRHKGRIVGIVAGFDRVLFRGTLRSISYVQGLEIFLRSQRILNKDFVAFAQQATEHIRRNAEAWAQRCGRPLQYLASSTASKEDYVRAIAERDGIEQGLICVLSCVEPCQTFRVRRNRTRRTLDLAPQTGKCLHLYFYFIDPQFGFMHVRLQTWWPFSIQVCVNGREWLARQLDSAGIAYEKRDNCFTRIAHLARAQRMMDRLAQRHWSGFLNAWARRVNSWLRTPRGRALHGYYWSVRQHEYATDVLFRDAASLAHVYPSLVRHAIEQFHTDDVLRFLGRRARSPRGEVTGHFLRREEGVRVKHRVAENSIRMYDKQGSVLRIETTINNPWRFKVRRRMTRGGQTRLAWLRLRKGVADMRRRVQICRAANARYLDALSVVGESQPCHRVLDPVSRPVLTPKHRYRPLSPVGPFDSSRLALLQNGEYLLHGFRNRDLYADWCDLEPPDSPPRQTAARIGRWLKLLRAHGLVHKVPHTHTYRISKKGHLLMTTAAAIRGTDTAALAAA